MDKNIFLKEAIVNNTSKPEWVDFFGKEFQSYLDKYKQSIDTELDFIILHEKIEQYGGANFMRAFHIVQKTINRKPLCACDELQSEQKKLYDMNIELATELSNQKTIFYNMVDDFLYAAESCKPLSAAFTALEKKMRFYDRKRGQEC